MRSVACRLFVRAAAQQPRRIIVASASRALSSSPSSSPDFEHPKAKDLFERITQKCTKEEIPIIANEIMRILGRTLRKNEFYYQGFGGRRVKGGGGPAAEAAQAPVEEKKSTVDLKLAGFDAKAKIKVIKEVRAIAGLGLKEAKELVESAPKVIQKDIKPEDAEELKKKLEEVGATIEIV